MVTGARMVGGELALEIRVLAKHGAGVREIAREVGVSRNTVRRYLRDPGAVRYRGRPPRAGTPPIWCPPRPILQTDAVRFVGDPVALVVADTRAEAQDAAELVEVEYDPLPLVTETAAAGRPGAPPGPSNST